MGHRGSLLVAVVALIGLGVGCETKSGTDSGAPADSTEPIVIGSTLSLSGAFAATGAIHKIVGEMFVDRLNASGGLLDREVKWLVRDDESDQAKVATLYEQLITQDKVDLIIGPYATPNILSAMAVAKRHGFTMPHHTSVLAPLMDYECQFPGWSIGPEPNEFVPDQLFEAIESLPNPPKRVAILTNQNGSTDFISYGSEADRTGMVSIARQNGLHIVAEVRYPPTTTDWAPIATQVRDAAPDLVINDGLGVDPVNLLQAMKQLNYSPPLMFSLFPAPGPPLGLGATADGLMSVTIFEPDKSTLDRLGEKVAAIVDQYRERAEAAGLPYTVFETQAAASWTAWEILTSAVVATKGLNQKALCDELHAGGAFTIFNGDLTFDPKVNNFWPATQAIKQIQDGNWVTVWPEDRAAAPLRRPAA